MVHLLFGVTAPFSIIFSNVFITLLNFFLIFFQCYLKNRKGCHDLKIGYVAIHDTERGYLILPAPLVLLSNFIAFGERVV